MLIDPIISNIYMYMKCFIPKLGQHTHTCRSLLQQLTSVYQCNIPWLHWPKTIAESSQNHYEWTSISRGGKCPWQRFLKIHHSFRPCLFLLSVVQQREIKVLWYLKELCMWYLKELCLFLFQFWATPDLHVAIGFNIFTSQGSIIKGSNYIAASCCIEQFV